MKGISASLAIAGGRGQITEAERLTEDSAD